MNTKLTIRGDAQRKRFLGQNNIECIAHLVLLPRQMIKCCCNNDITSDYYVFLYKPLFTEGKEDTFPAGPSCGKRFIELGMLSEPPLTNIFDNEVVHGRESSIGNHSHSSDNKIRLVDRMTPLNKEMYLAISLLFMIWENPQNGALFNYMLGIIKYPHSDIFKYKVKTLHNAIDSTRGRGERTLHEMLKDMTEGKCKKYDIPLIREILKKEYNIVYPLI